jgi:hypothetical protein
MNKHIYRKSINRKKFFIYSISFGALIFSIIKSPFKFAFKKTAEKITENKPSIKILQNPNAVSRNSKS